MTVVQERENLAPNLDTDKNPEVRTFGDHELKKVPVRSLIMMPQVRAKMNPDYPAIRESIRDGDLINQPDIAVMNRETFTTYVEFVNKVWGSELTVEQFDDMAVDGQYHLVIAGHTRTEGILEIADEDGVNHNVMCKVHEANDPMDVVSIQLDENLHSKPTQERSALVIVESYLLGKEQGAWSNEEEFIAKVGTKLSKDQVKDAVGFARLPEEIRDFVFTGQLQYSAALALGRGSQTIEDYVMAEMGYVMIANDKQKERFDKAYNLCVTILVAEVTNRKLNSTAAKKYIQAKIDKFQMKTRKILGVADINEPQIKMATAADQDKIYARQLRREFDQAMQAVATSPVAATEQALLLFGRLSGVDTKEAQEVAARGRKRLVKSMGDVGLFADALVNEAEQELMLGNTLFDDFENEFVA